MEPAECRGVMKYLFLKGNTPQQIYDEMKSVYGQDGPSYSAVKKWCREFRCGRTSVETAPKSGRAQSAIDGDSVQKIQSAILADRRVTIRELAAKVGISVGSVEKIIQDHLHMKKVSARWVPRLLTPFQKQARVDSCRELLELCHDNPDDFFSTLVTQDETWVHHYDPETKQQSKQWKHASSPPPKKARVQASAGKVMLTVFWDQQGVLLIDFLQKGTTINGAYYASLLVKLRAAIKEKRRGMLTKGVRLLQDNAPVHNSRVALTQARSCGYDVLPHPPYSPDLAPSDFFLFPNLKLHLKGKHFHDDDSVINEVTSWLTSKNADFYRHGIQSCKKRWEKCVALQGTYVEKD